MTTLSPQLAARVQQWKAKGYPRLASLMGKSQDVAIFRRFNEFNMLNLLRLQAEIAALGKGFWTQCTADDLSNPPFDKLSESFLSQPGENGPGDEDQHQILSQIREKMKEYNELLLQVSQLSKLSGPLKEDLSFFRSWLQDPKGGADFLVKNKNPESFLYEKESTHDLLTLSSRSKPSQESDPFTRLLRKTVLYWYHVCIGQHRKNESRMVDVESGTVLYEESVVDKSASIIATVLSSVLPLIAIIILNHWKSTQTRIYIAVGITAAFALVLALFTNARRVEIFAATATFAAVEVVFIGSISDGKGSA